MAPTLLVYVIATPKNSALPEPFFKERQRPQVREGPGPL